uniref:Uncharacterized protein n=1 Tax=Oryza barthii TaxID=65489 RepID=A0A0D3EQF3_9ORYZ
MASNTRVIISSFHRQCTSRCSSSLSMTITRTSLGVPSWDSESTQWWCSLTAPASPPPPLPVIVSEHGFLLAGLDTFFPDSSSCTLLSSSLRSPPAGIASLWTRKRSSMTTVLASPVSFGGDDGEEGVPELIGSSEHAGS